MSVAFMLSTIGLLVLCFLTYFGLQIYGFSPMAAFGIDAGVFLAGMAAMLYSVKAKGAGSDFKKWRIVEIVSVAVMVLLVAGSAAFVGAGYRYMFGPTQNEASLAAKDMDAVIDRYLAVQNERLEATVTGLSNFAAHHANQAQNDVQWYISRSVLGGSPATMLNSSRIQDFRQRTKDFIENGSNEVDRISYRRSQIYGLRLRAARWDASDVNLLGDDMRSLADSIAVELRDISAEVRLPLIQATGSSYSLEETEVPSFYTPSSVIILQANIAGLKDMYGEEILVLAVVALVFFFNYLISLRTLAAPVGRGPKISDKYGFPL